MTDREKLIKLIQTSPADIMGNHGIGNMADHLIANGVTIGKDTNVPGKWIPVTERLPTREDANETESILAIHKDDGFVGRWIWDIVARFHTEFTHWMALPEPPKEELP